MKDPSIPDLCLTRPTAIPFEQATRFLWGDKASGEVSDWVYCSSPRMHQLVFGMPSGGAFRHSEQNKTIFGADILYYVLEGLLVLNNPQTGEVHRVNRGEAVFFRKDTWHHGFSFGEDPLRVLEFFCPSPHAGTAQPYARTKPNLTQSRYGQDAFLGRWPAAQKETAFTMRVLREPDILWRLEGERQQALVGILVSTEHLTVGKLRLLPGQSTDVRAHGGDLALYTLEGQLNVKLPEADGPSWFELRPKDAFFVPQGTRYQIHNIVDRPLELVFGVAPSYLS
jgi:quercetin dioxygenase-like cupin family protein